MYLLAYFEEDESGAWVISEEYEFDTFDEALEELNFNYFACIDKKVMYEDIECYKMVARTSFYAEVYGK